MTLRATLLTDGSSDRVLLPILRWLCGAQTPAPVEVRWADLRILPRPPRSLADRMKAAVALYPCELLFVHRDAEKQAPEDRHAEIVAADQTGLTLVCVVPVRMQEAWLLHDDRALREAAGRPSNEAALGLPPPSRWEGLPDPKHVLHEALITASGATGRRARRFNPDLAAHRLAELITDWSPLRQLGAFRRLEADTRQALSSLGLPTVP